MTHVCPPAKKVIGIEATPLFLLPPEVTDELSVLLIRLFTRSSLLKFCFVIIVIMKLVLNDTKTMSPTAPFRLLLRHVWYKKSAFLCPPAAARCRPEPPGRNSRSQQAGRSGCHRLFPQHAAGSFPISHQSASHFVTDGWPGRKRRHLPPEGCRCVLGDRAACCVSLCVH